MNRRKNKFFACALATVCTGAALVLGITTIGTNLTEALFNRDTNPYTLTLNSSNKATSNGDKVQKTALGNNVTFTYSNVNSSTSGHVTLNDGGYLTNKDQIRSITSFTCTFSSGALNVKSSYGGGVWNDGFSITSGTTYQTGSNPYFLKFTATGSTLINSIVFEYNCLENPEAHEGETGGDDVIYYQKVTTEGAYSGEHCLIVYEESEYAFDGSKSSLDTTSNYVSVSIENDTIAYTSALAASEFEIGENYVKSAYGYYIGGSAGSNTLNCSELTQYSNSISIDSEGNADICSNTSYLRFNNQSGQYRFRYFKSASYSSQQPIAIYEKVVESTGPSWDTPKDCIGFTATDSKALTYKTTDVFDTANGLSVVANYSDGTSETLSKGGANGYSYVVKDSDNNVVDTSAEFGNLGGKNSATFTVTVSYKNYIPQEYQITVNFVAKLVGIVVESDVLSFNTAQKLSDYVDCITADLTFNKTTLNETEVPYSEFSDRGLTLSLLNPNGITSSISSVFGTAGTWTIKVTSNEDATVYGQLQITVEAIQVQTITVSGAGGATTLEEEATLQLSVAVTPTNATTQTVTWTSGNTAVATVNNNGLVTGVSTGNVRITATATDGSQVYGYIDLTVTEKPAQTLLSDELTNSNTIGETTTTYKDWTVNSSTSGTKYAGQSAGGNGAIQLRSNNSNSGIVSTTTVGRITKVKVTWNSNTSSERVLNVYGSNTAYTTPSNLYTSSSGTLLGTIDCESSTELTISGNYTYVGVRSSSGALYLDGITFTWSTQQTTPVYPTNISLSGTQSISVGGTSQLAVNYTPSDTNVKNVTFSSSNTSVATVSDTGLVTGVAAGSATITATAQKQSGTITATISITVSAIAVTSVSLNKSATTITAGSTEQLTATISPSNAGNKNVTWTTSNSSVATVSNGLVTGVAAGSATITVTTVDGNKTATCSVTVVSGGGSGSSGTATIAVSDIPTTYNTNDGNTSASGYTFTAYNVASSYTSGAMQWKKSQGYIENTTPIEGLINITIASISGKTFNGTLYSGTTQSPSSNSQSVSSGNTYTFAANSTYFRLAVNSATGYTGDISLAYSTTPVDPTAITVSPSSCELAKGGTKELSVSYTPTGANQHKDVTWSRYSGSSNISVSSSGVVSVSSNASVGNTAVIRATLNYNGNIYSQCTVTVVEQQSDDQTILIYMCGSDLESNGQTNSSRASGYATGDLTEILSVSNQPDDVNVVIETGGAKCWKSTYGINANYLERYHVENKQLVRDDQISKANMGSSSTLQSFITWGVQTYPADRVSLILWNHGGAMRGVCYDENYSSDSLTNSEVKTAVANSFSALGRSASDKFEWIGYDACLMQVQDIAEFNSQYFKYMVASEESEAGDGWDYDTWLDDAYQNKSTETILSAIVDGFIAATNKQYQQNGWGASDQTLSWLDLSYMSAYKTAWEAMASKLRTLSINKTTFQNMMQTVKYYGSDSDCEGYSYFGIFDAKDTLNKLLSNYSGASSEINAALAAFANLVRKSEKGSGAGNSYGLCCFFPMKDGSGYTCSTSSVYTTSQTNFTNWRYIVTTYGD